jgi:opacity protein-like surface antigen
MKTCLAALAVLTVVATPAFAQSFDAEAGTGNVTTFRSQSPVPRNDTFSVRQNGLHARAMVPRAHETFSPNSPASTGGGSLGYNEMLRFY